MACHAIDAPAALADLDALDAVVVAVAGGPAATGATSGWERILAEHDGIVEQIHADAQWARAVAELATTSGRPIRLVTVTDATTAGGRSRAQASAQLARAAGKATGDLVLPFAVSAESDERFRGAELVAHLVCSPEAVGLAGAELVTGAGWFGLRSHPRPIGSISFGGPAVPRVVRRHAPRGGAATMTSRRLPRPARIVDAHVHLWDPARTDWYPYLSAARTQLNMGDVSGMSRRFDVAHLPRRVRGLERREAGQRRRRHRRALDRRDPRTRPAGGRRRPPRCHRRRPAAHRLGGRGGGRCSTDSWRRPAFAASARWAPPRGRFRSAEVLRALQERDLLFEVMTHPDQLVATARGLEDHGDLVVVIEHAGWPRNDSDEERALWTEGIDALAGLGDNVLCKLSGLADAAGIDGRRRAGARGSSTPSTRSASTAACSRATSPSTGCTAPSTSSTRCYSAVTAGLDDDARDKLFAANAERIYRC